MVDSADLPCCGFESLGLRGGFYFWQKPKVAKTFKKIFLFVFN